MKKLIALLLCLVLAVGLLPTAASAAEKEKGELLEVTLAVYSNKLGFFDSECLYRDNVLYMHPYTICALTGALISDETETSVTFTIHEELRTITVSGNGRLREGMNYGPSYNVNADIDVAEYDGALYINAPKMLRYLGAVVGFGEDENSPTHMMVSMPYTVFDLIVDFANADGYAFSWAEADGKWVDPEDMVYLAAADTILLGYDSNILAYAAPGHGDRIQKQLYSDILYEILRTEGAEQSEDGFSYAGLFEQINDTWSFSADWIAEVMDWIEEDTFMPKLHSTMGNAMNASGLLISAGNDYIKSLECAMQFANMSTTQKELLDETLNVVSTRNPFYQQLPMLFAASEEVSGLIGNEYAAREKAAWDAVYSLMVNTSTSMMSSVIPFSIAWDSLVTIAKMDPLLEGLLNAEQNITFAAESQNISIIARSLISKDYKNLYKINFGMLTKDTSVQESLKASMILELKANLTIRNLLLDTGWLKDGAQKSMQTTAYQTADLLNWAQNAKPITFGNIDIRKEDITWIANLAGNCRIGWTQAVGETLYYWKYTADDFGDGAYWGYFNQVETTPVELIRRNPDGKEKELFAIETATDFFVRGSKIYYSAHGELVIFDQQTGKTDNTGIWGSLVAVNPSGSFLICTNSDGIYTYRIADGAWTLVASDASFVEVYKNRIYYSKSPEYDLAIAGQVSLYSTTMSGESTIHLCTTKPDLYDGLAVSEAMIAQIRFGKEYVFFSYGSIGGTGMMYQGGNIMRVKYDGTGAEVLATGVGAQFSITDDEVANLDTEDIYYALFNALVEYQETEYGLMHLDPVSGKPLTILSLSEYEDATAGISAVAEAMVIGNKAYVLVHYGIRNPENDLGWREYYTRRDSVFYVKDLKSGELTELYRF